jgi:hypothetical protein
MRKEKMIIASMIAITILFLISSTAALSVTSAPSDGERKPVGPPEEKEPPAQEPCPDAFNDLSCSKEGKATGPFVQEAWGAAAIACDLILPSCYTTQATEMQNNKTICENVSGCKLAYVEDEKACGAGSSNYTDCTPNPNVVPNKNTSYTCTVSGSYNITDYECDRP